MCYSISINILGNFVRQYLMRGCESHAFAPHINEQAVK